MTTSDRDIPEGRTTPQIKICGLTRTIDAVECAKLGANAIGLVFYPKSPRNVSIKEARAISLSLPLEITTVGVFVNEPYSNIMAAVEGASLKAVQLHGNESQELVAALRGRNIIVIKALFVNKSPSVSDAEKYPSASAFLVECAGEKLPGGNALAWDWKTARGFGEKFPLVLAGGLSPENISQAISDSIPDAVDISSGVEAALGRKDFSKVKEFIDKVKQSALQDHVLTRKMRKIF